MSPDFLTPELKKKRKKKKRKKEKEKKIQFFGKIDSEKHLKKLHSK